MEVKKRLIEFLSYLGIGQLAFEEKVGLARGYVNNAKDNIRRDTLKKISTAYPELNTAWILTGEGSMIKDNSGIITGNNTGANFIGNKLGSNNVVNNLSLPDKGTQKIIRPDGSVELYTSDSGDIVNDLKTFEAENSYLKQRISDLQKQIEDKETIISLLKDK